MSNVTLPFGSKRSLRKRLGALGVVGLALVVGTVVAVSSAVGASTNLFATVSQSGTLVDGNGVSSVTHIGTGQYEVRFTSNVSACAYSASTKNAYSQALLISVASGHLSADGVYIETKNQGGGLTDGPFNLVVNCGTTGMQYAVVDYNGNLARSTSGATISSPGTGRYDITFPSAVNTCSYLANIGDPSNGTDVTPAVVETGSGPTTSTVYVETKNMGGGLTSGIPFHLSVICPSAPLTKELVVGANGLASRGSALTSSFNSGTGTYDVITNLAIAKACATVVTRGSTNTAVPYDPATVETVSGPASNTFRVQTRYLLGFGGNLNNEAFHAAIVC